MKLKFWILSAGLIIMLAGISSFIFMSRGNVKSASNIRSWSELSVVEKTVSLIGMTGLEATEYKKWYVENKKKLVVSNEIGKMKYELSYIPSEVLSLREAGSELSRLPEISKSYDGWEYYIFSFEDTLGSSNPFVKDQLKNVEEQIQLFMSFEMQKYLKLVAGKDTLPCSQFHYERTIGMSPRFQFMCAFETAGKIKGARTLLFEDVLFKNGTVKLKMDEDKLNLSPGILLK